MTLRPRTLVTVQRVRERLRDLASADLARASAHAEQIVQDARGADAALTEFLDDSARRMRAASLTGLIRIGAELETRRAEVAAAEQARIDALAAVQASSAQVARREREVRSIEALRDRQAEVHEVLEARAEQLASDDHAVRGRAR
ncbi:MAG: hypothetical protein KBG48_05270 [Kofleriaceae bacterium]|jgi:flagellar biosynthesis chaperone FliJ|nr:hypothetical protein [Kofleriaceae bacterium]MBP9166772.1 hypothetical protein [Kofleriaceae bacterium]MBP9857124.1 hypothetical protein [Kofleriaceae bacterium]